MTLDRRRTASCGFHLVRVVLSATAESHFWQHRPEFGISAVEVKDQLATRVNMSADTSDMDIDNQSEDGEIKKSPSKDMGDFRYRNIIFCDLE